MDALVVEVEVGGVGVGREDGMVGTVGARVEVEFEVGGGCDVLRSDVRGRSSVAAAMTGATNGTGVDGTVAAVLAIDDVEGRFCGSFACREEDEEDEDDGGDFKGGEVTLEGMNWPVLLFLFFKSSLIAILSSSEQLVRSVVASRDMFCTILWDGFLSISS